MIDLGLYRHFKGNYYFLSDVAMGSDGVQRCYYFNVNHPEYGRFVRDCEEWFSDVSEREDNLTHQNTRFAKIFLDEKSVSECMIEKATRSLERSGLGGRDFHKQKEVKAIRRVFYDPVKG